MFPTPNRRWKPKYSSPYHTKYDIQCHQFYLSCSILLLNHGVELQQLDVNPTLFVISHKTILGNYRFTVLQTLSLLPSGFSSKLQSSMTTLDHKLLTREGMVLTNGRTHPSSMTISSHSFIRNIYRKIMPQSHKIPYGTNYHIQCSYSGGDIVGLLHECWDGCTSTKVRSIRAHISFWSPW